MTSKPTSKLRAEDKYEHIKPLPDPPRKPDSMRQFLPTSRTCPALRRYFRDRSDVLINGQGYLCYDTRDRSNWTVPDCIVAFDVDPHAIEIRNEYVISEAGKPPDFVLEVASESTGRRDVEIKRDIYARLAIKEFWRFDPSGGEFQGSPMAGDILADGAYQPLSIHTDEDGTTWGHSPLLGLDLCWHQDRLRVYDPVSQEYVSDPDEAYDRADEEASARAAAEAEVRRLREELQRLNQG